MAAWFRLREFQRLHRFVRFFVGGMPSLHEERATNAKIRGVGAPRLQGMNQRES